MNYANLNITQLKGVGKKRAELFAKMGIDSVGALLEFYPRSYEDWSSPVAIKDAVIGEKCVVAVTVATPVREHRIRKGMTLYKFIVTDMVSDMSITVFNNKYAVEKLNIGDSILLYGKVGGSPARKEMSSPAIETPDMACLRPIYPLTAGLTSHMVEASVKSALQLTKDDYSDILPQEIRNMYSLVHKRYAIENIHCPESRQAAEAARKRLIFDELLILQLGLLKLRTRNKELTSVRIARSFKQEFLKMLPFTLTNAQSKAMDDIETDMCRNVPMNRLLQGDVGSGKTAVAVGAMFTAVKNGYQCAMMAPTEILAKQHYSSVCKILKGSNVRTLLLTGSMTASQKRAVAETLAKGEADIVIGTHALIQQGINFSNLGFVITDEQHRFGVKQRAALTGKGENPHTLVMSATPIPRTLALIIYGDLDVSVLDELPAGRQKIETYHVTSKLRPRAFNYVKKHLDEGSQGYIVCPMIEEGELPLAAANEYYEKLKNGAFKDYTVGLINGRMKDVDKDAVMRSFAAGEIQLLISTTVIEVGIDVPNAVIMIIENAERFGLSQLHQLRGRIGRGKKKSTCILISDATGDTASHRLSVMCKTQDGFKIADEDLTLRGPGEFFGSRQSGLPQLKIADLATDMEILRHTSALARKIISDDPHLEKMQNSGLKSEISRLFDNMQIN